MNTFLPITVFDCRTPSAPAEIGVLATNRAGQGSFAYKTEFLERCDAFPLDPVHLPLIPGELDYPAQSNGSLGVFSDLTSSAWGTTLWNGIAGLDSTRIDSKKRLLRSRGFQSGCLAFGKGSSSSEPLAAPAARSSTITELVLSELDQHSGRPDQMLSEATLQVLWAAADLDGMRPKTAVQHDGAEHIAKFSRSGDLFDVPRVEFATLRLAHLAGISVQSFELLEIKSRAVLLVERFDRTASRNRHHYLSAYSMLRPSGVSTDGQEYRASFSYAGIAEGLARLNVDKAMEDGHELYRRMVFNIMVGNIDDHMRNHAVIMRVPGDYRLSPAFDICPHPDAPYLSQDIGVGAMGTASTVENALSQCHRFLLSDLQAKAIVSEVREAVSGWRSAFSEAGVSKEDCVLLKPCFGAAKID